MKVRGWVAGLAVLVLTACGDGYLPWVRPLSRAQPSTTTPQCPIPDDANGACRPASILSEDEERPSILDAIDGPPVGWHPPTTPIPFGFVAPTQCVEASPVRDLDDACAMETYSPDGVLTAHELRGPNDLRRFSYGELIEEIVFDAAGRVLRRSSPDGTEVWAYRDDGAVVDHRWERAPDIEEREVYTCDGRIDQLLTSQCNTSARQYHYDTLGRLVRIAQSSENWNAIEDLVYDESSRLRVQASSNFINFWDDAGRLIRRDLGGGSVDSVEHHVYGPHGLVRTYYAGDGIAHYSALTEYRYDRGQLTLWWHFFDANAGLSFRRSTRSEAHRITYSCGGGKVLEEIDFDLDSKADRTIRWTPLADGTVHESVWTPENGAGGWKVYRFDCD